ncbi:radical SAM protein [Agrobacterium rubi]|nr:radical SAM protein [Agrobacterium rubi]NTF24229.1 radical SAM protein [Agrobacterium rubi]
MSSGSPKHLTIHARLLKGCNADCSYCSSWEQDPAIRISPEDFAKALTFVVDEIVPVMGCAGQDSTVSIQYVGGEILLVPKLELREIVYSARDILQQHFGTVIDGVQSNLIASERKILDLDSLFNGRIGTSVDGRGSQRTVAGSPDAYRRIFERSRAILSERRRRNPGAIFVVDAKGIPNLPSEIDSASEKGHPLVLRPVFSGGRDIESASVPDLVSAMVTAFDQWAMHSRVAVEPFMHLVNKRLHADTVVGGVCPFQRDCAQVSINIEPDGTLYTCLDMADSRQVPFGNALRGEFDRQAFETLVARRDNIDPRCVRCPYFDACQGGCMSEAIHHTGSIYGRSDLCAVWTALFERIDALVARQGRTEVSKWVSSCVR